MAKNIVICCDGTGNEFGESKSNVVKLYKMLVHDASQVTYYHPGVGTMGARNALNSLSKWWTKAIGLIFPATCGRAEVLATDSSELAGHIHRLRLRESGTPRLDAGARFLVADSACYFC